MGRVFRIYGTESTPAEAEALADKISNQFSGENLWSCLAATLIVIGMTYDLLDDEEDKEDRAAILDMLEDLVSSLKSDLNGEVVH